LLYYNPFILDTYADLVLHAQIFPESKEQRFIDAPWTKSNRATAWPWDIWKHEKHSARRVI